MPSSVLNYYHTINFSIANYMEKEEDAAEYFSAASQISMKTKNRFSILLEHLMSVADGRVDTSVTECIPHRIPDVRLFRIRLFTKRIIQQLSVNTDIYFRPR